MTPSPPSSSKKSLKIPLTFQVNQMEVVVLEV
jgi:hypothetical protein